MEPDSPRAETNSSGEAPSTGAPRTVQAEEAGQSAIVEGTNLGESRIESGTASAIRNTALEKIETVATTSSVLNAADKLEKEIDAALAGTQLSQGCAKSVLKELCRVIDYWIAEDTAPLIDELGLTRLATEIKKDYVLASFLAWRGEFKLAYVTLRSFLESFCLLLYYLNQGCDRLLYLKGRGYKLMLHRMAQKKGDIEEMHAFRRHYHLLIEEGVGNEKFADKFFDELTSCYSQLSKAVHGDYSSKPAGTPQESYLDLLQRVLRVCNTLALHDPVFSATEDDLQLALKEALNPACFEWRAK